MREDEEQNKKYEEIIELLLAAGYFRARIKGLSPFDKVRTIVSAGRKRTIKQGISEVIKFHGSLKIENF